MIYFRYRPSYRMREIPNTVNHACKNRWISLYAYYDSTRCRVLFQMAAKLTKDFDLLIETYEDDLNEEMILKGPLRRDDT